jgi:hypothetical protein
LLRDISGYFSSYLNYLGLLDETNSVTIQALRGRQNRIGVEGAAQHFQHAMSLLAQRVQA